MLLRKSDSKEQHLLAVYDKAVNYYAWAVRELLRHHTDMSADDFQQLRKIVESAHAECQSAKEAFDEYLQPPS